VKTPRLDPGLRRDIFKLAFVLLAGAGTLALFFLTPALSTPTLLSVMLTMFLSPLVAVLERRGYTRSIATLVVFSGMAVVCTLTIAFALKAGNLEWDSFQVKADTYYANAIERCRMMEESLKQKFPAISSVSPTDSLIAWSRSTGQWFVNNGTGVMGDLMVCVFLVPLLTYFLLNDGRKIRRSFFQLVPNRFFESFFLISHQITVALSDYLRAKLIEAFLVGLITTVGLAIAGAPYALMLGFFAGVTNVIPYIGPVIGAVPGIALFFMDPQLNEFLWPAVAVYAFANIIDTVVIFPIIVAKLVNLHPLILLAAVAVGQRYYGLIGMLISIPVAAIFKVVAMEVYAAIYTERKVRRSTS
jgi:putative permease